MSFITHFLQSNYETIMSFITIILRQDTDTRVLPRIQIQWHKWPTEFEKGGPFQKIWGPSELPTYDANDLSAFRHCKNIHNKCIQILLFENYR